jgi:adenine phosphoribosyltransferase
VASPGELRDDLLKAFRWVGGHADVWRFFIDAPLFARTIQALADPYRAAGISKVVGIESRGFILGGAVALELHAGFVAIRKQEGVFPGPRVESQTPADYRGRELNLRMQRSSVGPQDRVILVDDWLETGWQAQTARAMVEKCGAEFAGVAVIVDQLSAERRRELGEFHALLQADDLGNSQ